MKKGSRSRPLLRARTARRRSGIGRVGRAGQARYPVGTIREGLDRAGQFMPQRGMGVIDIFQTVQPRDPRTQAFLSELEGKTQAAALIAAQAGAADVRARVTRLFEQRTGALFNSIQAIPRGKTAAAVVVGARHAGILEKGSPAHSISPKPGGALAWPGSRDRTGEDQVRFQPVNHPGNRAYGFVEASREVMEETAEALIYDILKV